MRPARSRRAAYSCTLVCQEATSGMRELLGEVCAEDAELAGTGDVDDVGPKVARVSRRSRRVTQEERVEAQILFERERRRSCAEARACVTLPVRSIGLLAASPPGRRETAERAGAQRPRSCGWYARRR